ncbi:MAG: hypothetical protein EHM70_18270 [Chloroflexota bacterium]|nr:MAG: hypothetical protein EHM70_18270 [Chloroflexota bacterium]
MPKPRISISSSRLTNSPQAGDVDTFDETTAYPVATTQHAKRTEFIPISRVMPDPYQARVLLPTHLATQFYQGEIDCFTAGREWLALAAEDEQIARRVNELLSLGNSLNADGQIKNATGSWQRINDSQAVFVLETGERRFWGLVLWAIQSGATEEPVIEAVSVPEPNRVRQVIENEKNEPPTAVARARAIAGLINYYYQIDPPADLYSRYDFHRKALGIRVSMKIWAELERVFNTSRNHLSEHLQILVMPDSLLDLADDFGIPERRLREIRKYPENEWEALIHSVIQDDLTSDQIRENPDKQHRRSTDPITKSARQIKGALLKLSRGKDEALGALADSLYAEFDSPDQARFAADQLEDLANQIRVRVDGQDV